MDINIEENHEGDSVRFEKLSKTNIETTDEESTKFQNELSTTNCDSHEDCSKSKATDNHESCINQSIGKSELESEVTNLSSTLDSRDDELNEHENQCESSLDLSYNKTFINSVESSLDNSESTLGFEKQDENLTENILNTEKLSNEKEKNVFLPKINGSSSTLENVEQKENIEDVKKILNNDDKKHNVNEVAENKVFTANENSCSSSSSSIGLVIDQQPEFSNNIIMSQLVERDKDEYKKEITNLDENQQNSSSELKIKLETLDNCENAFVSSNECSSNISENLNREEEELVKENKLKRKHSFYEEECKSNNDHICSPQHKIIHLDESYISGKKTLDLENNFEVSTTNNNLDYDLCEKNSIKNVESNKILEQLDMEGDISEKSIDLTIDTSSPILRNQLVLKNTDNDPGGFINNSPKNVSNETLETNIYETPSSTTTDESRQNENKNCRFNVHLSSFGNNYLYEKNEKLTALNSSDNLNKIEEDALTSYKIKSEESSIQNENEIKDLAEKPNVGDFSNNLILNKLDLSTLSKNSQSLDQPVNSNNIDETHQPSGMYTNSLIKTIATTNETLIDLTNDSVDALSSTNSNNVNHQNLTLTPKEKILQDWNKISSLPSFINQSPNPQDLNKQSQQSSSDIKRFDNTSFNNQVESSISNKLDTVTNYPNSSKLLNNPSWKFSLKYGKQNQNTDNTTNKSLKRSSKNLYQNKSSRQNNITKKSKEYPIPNPSTNYHSSSIINSSQFSIPNKLNPPVIPPVYELSHTLNRHTEYKCSKCFSSNFKNIRELENHHKFCLYPTNPNESIFLNQQQQQQLGLSAINNKNRIQQFPTGINNLIHNVDDVILNVPKEPNLPNFRNLLNKQQSPLFNINDKPIEITPNLNHYLTQVEQKHKNLLQQHHHHHLNHNQNLFSHSLDETIKRTFLQSDSRQNLTSSTEQKLISENHNRYGGLFNSAFQNRKKISQLQQQQIPVSLLDNGNILDYPIIQDSSNIFEINESPLNFNSSGFSKNSCAGLNKGLRRFSSSNSIYGSNADLSSSTLTVNKQQLDNIVFPTTMQQKSESLEPIMLKVKQNQFSPILPPDQLLNKLATQTSLSTSFSSASSTSSSFQESSNFNINSSNILENLSNTENVKKKITILERRNTETVNPQNKNNEKENKNRTLPNSTQAIGKNQNNSTAYFNNENLKTKMTLKENKSITEKKTKKLFLCSSCGSYHENWNLFLHMREMHKRHICLVCLRMFPTAEQLTVHLEMKHDIEQNHFESQEKLIRSSRDSCYLMCCTCEHIFTEHDDFYQHVCANYLKPCTLCGLLGKHAQTCKYGTNENKRNKRIKKISNMKSQQKQQNSFNSSVSEILNTEITTILANSNQKSRIEELQNKTDVSLKKCTNQNSVQLLQYSDCDRASNKEDNKTYKENQIKYTSNDSVTNILDSINDNHDSDSNNESDSDSNKFNGYLEHFNYNDNDLINLYKSNRIANLAKQKEKEEAEAKAKSSIYSELVENQIINANKIQIPTTEKFKNKENLETMNSEKSPMPKLTLKISKKLLNQAKKISDESDEQSSTETTDAEDNEYDNKSDIDENDTTTEDKQQNTSNSSINETDIVLTEVAPEIIEENITDTSKVNEISDLESQVINNEKNAEEEKNVDVNKIEEQIDDSKSDSDMDIDVTCNQGGDVAPISNIDLQNENQKETLQNFIVRQKIKNFTEDMQIDRESPKQITPVQPENNDTDSNVIQLPQNSIENTENEELSSLTKNESILNEDCNDGSNLTIVSEPEKSLLPLKKIPTDGIDLANDDVQILELSLNAPLDRISMTMLLRIMLKQTYPICLYCNHARRIAVNGNSLALHMLSSHRFSATVDSITAEELLPGTIITKLKSYLEELNGYYFNMETYCNIDKVQNVVCPTIDEKIFECFSCRFSTKVHKDLYLHNRKMHLKTAIFCFMCRSNFYSYSEILCHICPGAQHKVVLFDIKFRCCICALDQIPSAFRLMVHLRKAHFACDVCLENCYDQSRLSSHVWKHKLHHLCYRCGIAYRNKPDITKHLFWKHGTESILCKRCLQKRWPHVYHFCVPPTSFVCEVCNLTFTRAMYLKVHKRLHSGDAPYPCAEDNCDKKFISRKLLLKHVEEHEKIEREEKINDIPESTKIIKEEMDTDIKKSDEEPELKDEKSLTEDKNEEKTKVEENDEHLTKKKKKKSKRCSETKESLEDLNLQAPNLSESGSSDDSDTEIPIKQKTIVPNVMLSPPSEQDEEEEGKTESNPEKIIDIWNNFKTFQATQSKVEDCEIDDSNFNPPTPILHVVQSDHDYCRMFKVSIEKKSNNENEIENKNLTENESIKTTSKNLDKNSRSLLLPVSPSKRKQKTTKKSSHIKSGSESSSSDGTSSSSDSSCTCGSNCSCSSTTDSSSDSSSSSDTDSSSSEGKKRIAAKKAEKEERRKRNRLQSENSSKANNSDVVDVVTTDIKPEPKLLEPVIYEDDLETDESDTDEDFYDEHPQKLASEILAEKRRQLMKQTCLSPSHNFDIVENSRPSTPSLPEDVYGSINSREKKPKIKKKKRERKSSNKNLIPPFKLSVSKTNTEVEISESPFIPPIAPKQINGNGTLIVLQGNKSESFISMDTVDSTLNRTAPSVSENIASEISTLYQSSTPTTSVSSIMYQNVINPASSNSTISASIQPKESMSQNYQTITTPSTILNPSLTRPPIFSASNMFSTLLPAPINPNFIRHSTESSSDAGTNLLSNSDNALKRSKRARRPNRFYGYSSDDETTHGTHLLGAAAVFKPVPPPNLTWRKEDLPTPPRNILSKSFKTGLKSSLVSSGKKIKLFSKKKENPNKKDKQLGSKFTKIGNSSGVVKPQIPKIKIKPLDILPQIPLSILEHQSMDSNSFQHVPQPPPVVEPINSLPPVPVHHIDPPQFYTSSKESIDSDSESDEDKLTIPIQVFSSETKSSVQSKTKKSLIPKTPKGNQNKTNKKVKNNSSGPRTSYNSTPQPQISNLTSLQNIPTEIKEPAPPPPPKEKKIPLALLPNPDLATLQYFKRNNIRYPIRPPAGARAPREGESVYCYCRCPYDEVSEMIACDGDDCMIEWFHFECVGILVAPQGKWFCAECKPNQQVHFSPQNTPLQQQFQQLPQQNSESNHGNLSINISGFNGSSNNSNINLGTNSGSMGY